MKNQHSNEDLRNILLWGLVIVSILFAVYAIYDNYSYDESVKKQMIADKAEEPAAFAAPAAKPEGNEQINNKASPLPEKTQEEMVKETWAAAERDNAEIDKAQDDVLEDFRKKSVKHLISNGAGNYKVDTFILKNGDSVTCITSVSDFGKAVDCH